MCGCSGGREARWLEGGKWFPVLGGRWESSSGLTACNSMLLFFDLLVASCHLAQAACLPHHCPFARDLLLVGRLERRWGRALCCGPGWAGRARRAPPGVCAGSCSPCPCLQTYLCCSGLDLEPGLVFCCHFKLIVPCS